MFVDPGVYLVDWLARPQTELVPSQARQRKDDGLLMMIVDDWDVFFVFFFHPKNSLEVSPSVQGSTGVGVCLDFWSYNSTLTRYKYITFDA